MQTRCMNFKKIIHSKAVRISLFPQPTSEHLLHYLPEQVIRLSFPWGQTVSWESRKSQGRTSLATDTSPRWFLNWFLSDGTHSLARQTTNISRMHELLGATTSLLLLTVTYSVCQPSIPDCEHFKTHSICCSFPFLNTIGLILVQHLRVLPTGIISSSKHSWFLP